MGSLLNPFAFGIPVCTVAFLGYAVAQGTGTLNLNVDTGAVDSTKEIFIVAQTWTNVSPKTLSTPASTVNGVAVTKAAEFLGDSSAMNCAFAALPSVSGVVTASMVWSGIATEATFAVYKVLNRPGRPGNNTDSSFNLLGSPSNSTELVGTTTINADGIWFGTASNNDQRMTSPTGTIEDADFALGGGGYQFCHRDQQVAGSSPTDVWSWGGPQSYAMSASWAFA